MIQEKWVIIQPTHRGGQLCSPKMRWTNDSFHMLSKLFNAPLYHIDEFDIIPKNADAYILCSFNIGLIEKEIEFIKEVKSKGAKVLVGFSQDLRFLLGCDLLNSNGILYTELCKEADIISSGVNPNLRIYGRFQDKVIPFGEVIVDENWEVPIEDKKYDLIACEAVSEYGLAFELEFLLCAKEKYPDHKIACVIAGQHLTLIEKLRNIYPQLEFPFNPETNPHLLSYIREAKVFCNPELRPRPCRTAMESYYCRVPFISSEFTYHSRICPRFTYDRMDFKTMVDKYSLIIESDRKSLINEMEENAKFDHFENVYNRIKKAFGWE